MILTRVLAMAAVSLTPLAFASSESGPMAIFGPYVGAWSCREMSEGQPTRLSEFSFELEGQLLRQIIRARDSAEKSHGEVESAAFAFDSRSGRYVEIEMNSGARWYVSTAAAPANGIFQWKDTATSETASRWEMSLPANNAFTIASFSHEEDQKPSYRADCNRKMG